MSTLSGMIDPFYDFVIESSVGASVVVLVVLVLQRLFANRLTPRSRYLLWSVLLLRLMLPWTPSSPFSAADLVTAASNRLPTEKALAARTSIRRASLNLLMT